MISCRAIAGPGTALGRVAAQRGSTRCTRRVSAVPESKPWTPLAAPTRPQHQTVARAPFSSRNADSIICAATSLRRDSEQRGNALADIIATFKGMLTSVAAAFVAAFSFAGAAMAGKTAAVTAAPMNPIAASIALMTSKALSLDEKLMAMAADPTLAIVPGILSIASAILALGGVMYIIASNTNKEHVHINTRAEAVAESQDLAEATPISLFDGKKEDEEVAQAAAVAKEKAEDAALADALSERIEATKQRVSEVMAGQAKAVAQAVEMKTSGKADDETPTAEDEEAARLLEEEELAELRTRLEATRQRISERVSAVTGSALPLNR